MRYDRWTVMGRAPSRNGKAYLKVKCDCGSEREVRKTALTGGKSKSCGCLVVERMKSQKYGMKHGDCPKGRKCRLYSIHTDMKSRCFNPKLNRHEYYYDKGIQVCDEWMDYETFKEWSLENGYQDNLTIDRIDSNGNYEPNNCRWITKEENSRRSALSTPRKNNKWTKKEAVI